MLFKRGETIVYGSTHTTAASLNGSIWISIETVSSRRAARWRHSRITIQFSVVWSSTFGPGCIPGPFETYEKHHYNQNEDNLKTYQKINTGKKYFANVNSNCYIVLDLINLKEKVKKEFCFD